VIFQVNQATRASLNQEQETAQKRLEEAGAASQRALQEQPLDD